jgi:hypothetical protein
MFIFASKVYIGWKLTGLDQKYSYLFPSLKHLSIYRSFIACYTLQSADHTSSPFFVRCIASLMIVYI